MKNTSIFALAGALIPHVSSHYVFWQLVVNDTLSEPWQYVRDVRQVCEHEGCTPINKLDPQVEQDILSTNITCGRLAILAAPNTETATVLAGSTIGFHTEDEHNIFHTGLAQIFLGKVDDTEELETTKGDQLDWFKIGYIGPANDTHWKPYHEYQLNVTIPQTTPPGKYLLRIEHIYVQQEVISNKGGVFETQFYVNCAHIDIVGSGGGTPTEYARFPGTYKLDTPELTISAEQSGVPAKNLLAYKPPGPAVWTG